MVAKVWNASSMEGTWGKYEPEYVSYLENRLIPPLPALDGWRVTGGEWRVNGMPEINGKQTPAAGWGWLLYELEEFGDLTIELDVLPVYGQDTGIVLRSDGNGNGYQVCIDYAANKPLGGIYGNGIRSYDYWVKYWDYVVKDIDEVKPANSKTPLFDVATWPRIWRATGWNTIKAQITGNPPRIQVWINGTKVQDFQETELLHPGLGKIGLQVHDGTGNWPACFLRHNLPEIY